MTKPSRGLFAPATLSVEPTAETVSELTTPRPPTLREEEFYASFADWLRNDLDEVTVAAALGGAGLRNKWGTPDVVGVYKPSASDRIKFPLQIVSAEIKVSPSAPVEAFGQAVAYRLFSTKSYVVMPNTLGEADSSRLEALCILFGIGLVIFNPDRENPNFVIRVRAQRFLPDMFYVNEFADGLHRHNREMFDTLFA